MEGINNIARNTLYLYIRMGILMLISLYTSRVTLDTLGVEDFGIYSIVAGVIVLLSFLSTSMNNACMRYMSIAVASKNINTIQKNFSTSLVLHIILSVIVLIILETIGYVIVKDTLNIPDSRREAAIYVLHYSVIATCFNTLRIPFNASIIACERMSFYAISGIIEGILKLLAAFAISLCLFDKLMIYSILISVISIIIFLLYVFYCMYSIKGNSIELKPDRELLKQMIKFSGWNLANGLADLGCQQGTNMLLNSFWGVQLNAAMGITNQLRNAVFSFVTYLQMAANPQIIKSYANNDKVKFNSLVFAISRYSYYLILLIVLPVIFNVDYILKLWLKNPPDHTSNFVILILVFSIFDSLIGPLWICNQASGDIKKYSITVSIILLLNLPFTALFFHFGAIPEATLWIRIAIAPVSLCYQLIHTCHKVKMKIYDYFNDVLIKIVGVSIVTVIPAWIISQYISGLSGLVISFILVLILLCLSVYKLGTTQNERNYIRSKILGLC